MTKLWHSFFEEVDVKSWTIYKFHKNWINCYKDQPEYLVYGKAVDVFAKSLGSIANSNSDIKKVEKAKKLFKGKYTYIQSTLYKCTPLGTEHKCAFKEGVHL